MKNTNDQTDKNKKCRDYNKIKHLIHTFHLPACRWKANISAAYSKKRKTTRFQHRENPWPKRADMGYSVDILGTDILGT
jgi:hypothetical protein